MTHLNTELNLSTRNTYLFMYEYLALQKKFARCHRPLISTNILVLTLMQYEYSSIRYGGGC
jgi:hypothetical protein